MILDRTAILLALLCVLVFPNIIRAFLSNGKCLSRDGPYFSKSPEKGEPVSKTSIFEILVLRNGKGEICMQKTTTEPILSIQLK